jgi:3-oxo-5alpha-steroid 4-dehydrogenase
VRLLTHAPVRRLVVDGAGVVVGVVAHRVREELRERHQALYRTIVPLRPFRWKRHASAIAACAELENKGSEAVFFRARRGVLLSGGGFVFGRDMLARHRSLLARLRGSLLHAGAMSCDGSGIELGRSVGGATRLMESFFLGKVLAPPSAFVHGILVDATGRRFINEDAYTSALGNAVADLPEHGKAWLILDHELFWEAVHQCIRPGKGMYIYTLPALANLVFGGTRRAKSIEKLSRTCRFDLDTFSATIDQYNSAATGKAPDPLGKDSGNLAPVDKPPFYAIRMDLGNPYTPAMAFSLGGLVVDETTGAVLDRAGKAIPHLYAAGRNAVGLCSSGYISGMSIADTVFSGRRAAQTMTGTAIDGP